MSKTAPLVINGWKIFGHALFLNQLETLIQQVEKLKKKDPENYNKKKSTKHLAAISKLAFDIIPRDPTVPSYRQCSTMGKSYKHWFRAKFFQQYRLFFRYHMDSKIIVYAWVNDESTKRVYNSKSDAYKIFKKMLNNGHPPDDWNQLLKEAKKEIDILDNIISGI